LINIDCFRVYEAIISGAIPVGVSVFGQYEIESVFEHEGDHRPPLLFVLSFQEAPNKSDAADDSVGLTPTFKLIYFEIKSLIGILIEWRFLKGV
jgi:hypothetical protein